MIRAKRIIKLEKGREWWGWMEGYCLDRVAPLMKEEKAKEACGEGWITAKVRKENHPEKGEEGPEVNFASC